MSKCKTLLVSDDAALYVNAKSKSVKQLWDMSFQEISDIFYKRYNRNTGTICLTAALKKQIEFELFDSIFNTEKLNDLISSSNYKTIICTDLHHLSEGYDFSNLYIKLLGTHKDIKFVPLQVGIMEGYRLPNDTVKLMHMISERNEIGVRNEYVAERLSMYGIKNVRIIGCPSLFYHMDRGFSVNPKSKIQNPKSINFNCTIYNFNNDRHTLNFLNFIKQYCDNANYEIYHTLQEDFLLEVLQQYRIVYGVRYSLPTNFWQNEYLLKKGRYFFNFEEWYDALARQDFTLGTKFHGNCMSVLAGTPALYLAVDERMRGLCQYHRLPYINYEDFDSNLPIEHYYELADYTEFNKNYAKTYDNYVDYCRKNGVELKIDNMEKPQ